MAITKVTRELLSTGIDDNSNATAITIDSSERVSFSANKVHIGSSHADAYLYGGAEGDEYGGSSNNSASWIRFSDNTSNNAIMFNSGNASGGFRWEVAGSEKMRIDSSGHVTMPNQPCFSAPASYTNIPLATTTQVTLGTERFDNNGDLSGNVFTAPVGGKYLFTYIFYFSSLDNEHTTLDATIKTSNTQYQQTVKPSAFMNADNGNFSLTGSMICDMDANDTFHMNVYVSAGQAQTDIHGDSHVSGCLLA